MGKEQVLTVTLNPAIDKTITLSDFQLGKLNRVKNVRSDPGGKGINVAKVLKKFGIDVNATGLIAGQQGSQIINQLDNQGIRNSFIKIIGEIRTNLKIVDDKSNLTTEINEPGFNVSSKDLERFILQLSEQLKKDSILVLGGSLPSGAPVTIYYDIIQLANQKGVKVIFDADGNAFKEGIKAKPFAVKPNVFELEQFFNKSLKSDEEILLAAKEIIKLGISLVIISMGEKGSIIMDKHEVYRISTFPIVPRSTVGAGDSMVASLVYSLLTKKSLEEIAIWATTAGTITASKNGTQVCTLDEVQKSINKVQSLKIT